MRVKPSLPTFRAIYLLFDLIVIINRTQSKGILRHIMTDIQANYATLAKQYNCEYRTVKRY
ncbi:hypothetical protein R3X30_12860 [Enterococcus faecalis]